LARGGSRAGKSRAERGRLRGRRGLLALGAWLGLLCAGIPAQAGERPNLLLICVDTLRADRTSVYRYVHPTTPSLGAFAARGALFELVHAPMSETAPSTASILTGQYPARHGLLRNGLRLGEEARTLAEVLAGQGWQTAAIVSSFPLSARFGLAQGFDRFDDEFDPARASVSLEEWEGNRIPAGFDRRADETTRRAQRWLWARDRARPFFLFVHYFDPHSPYAVPKGFDPQLPLPPARDDAIGSSLEYRLEVRRYHEEIAFADHQIGELLEVVEREGLTDDTLVVVTADHGEGLLDHGHWLHGLDIYEEAVRVPLLVRWPGRIEAGLRVPGPALLVDLAPTLLELLGAEGGGPFDGRSLAGRLLGRPGELPAAPAYLYRRRFEKGVVDGIRVNGELFGVRLGRFKLIDHPEGDSDELYDLERDPGERRNLIESAPEEAAKLRDLLEAWRRTHAGPKPQAPPGEDERRALEALGYVEASPEP
jgi:arylsulfatase A-like enzyme